MVSVSTWRKQQWCCDWWVLKPRNFSVDSFKEERMGVLGSWYQDKTAHSHMSDLWHNNNSWGATVSFYNFERQTMLARIKAGDKTGQQLARWIFTQKGFNSNRKQLLWRQSVFTSMRYSLIPIGFNVATLSLLDVACMKHLRRIYREPVHLHRNTHHDFLTTHGIADPLVLLLELCRKAARRDALRNAALAPHDILCRMTPINYDERCQVLLQAWEHLRNRVAPVNTLEPDTQQACPICHKLYPTLSALRRHLTTVHAERSGPLRPIPTTDFWQWHSNMLQMQTTFYYLAWSATACSICLHCHWTGRWRSWWGSRTSCTSSWTPAVCVLLESGGVVNGCGTCSLLSHPVWHLQVFLQHHQRTFTSFSDSTQWCFQKTWGSQWTTFVSMASHIPMCSLRWTFQTISQVHAYQTDVHADDFHGFFHWHWHQWALDMPCVSEGLFDGSWTSTAPSRLSWCCGGLWSAWSRNSSDVLPHQPGSGTEFLPGLAAAWDGAEIPDFKVRTVSEIFWACSRTCSPFQAQPCFRMAWKRTEGHWTWQTSQTRTWLCLSSQASQQTHLPALHSVCTLEAGTWASTDATSHGLTPWHALGHCWTDWTSHLAWSLETVVQETWPTSSVDHSVPALWPAIWLRWQAQSPSSCSSPSFIAGSSEFEALVSMEHVCRAWMLLQSWSWLGSDAPWMRRPHPVGTFGCIFQLAGCGPMAIFFDSAHRLAECVAAWWCHATHCNGLDDQKLSQALARPSIDTDVAHPVPSLPGSGGAEVAQGPSVCVPSHHCRSCSLSCRAAECGLCGPSIHWLALWLVQWSAAILRDGLWHTDMSNWAHAALSLCHSDGTSSDDAGVDQTGPDTFCVADAWGYQSSPAPRRAAPVAIQTWRPQTLSVLQLTC